MSWEVWPTDFLEVYPAHQAAKGATGAALQPLCKEVVATLQLCLVVTEGGTRRPVNGADLDAWQEPRAAAEARARAAAEAGFDAAVQLLPVEDTDLRYGLRAAGDGLDAGALLLPERLAARVGGPVLLALPTQGTVLFWKQGNEELDRILAVGARRAWEASERPVTDAILRHDGNRWVEWGRATPSPAPPAP